MNLENFGWPETWATVLTGFVVVFLALILLIIIFWAFGKVMDNLTKNSKPAAPAADPAPPVRTVPAPKKAVEFAADGVSDDVIAAITGAISAILAEEGDGRSYVVRSVKRVRKSRGAWGRAGMEENTRPF